METQSPPNYQAGHRRDVDGQWQSVSWSPANVQGVARQVLGWSGVVTRQPLSAVHQFSGWSTPSLSLTQALQTYIDLTQA